MKTLVDQLAQYADYHRDRRNIASHFIGIPLIVLGLVAHAREDGASLRRPLGALVALTFAGSLALFYFTMVIYGLSLVGFGLLISSLCSTQQQAFIGVFVFMMPAILLSGYVSPVENMPVWLQNLTWINPIRHFTDITKQIYLKDASLDIVWNSLWPLLVITATTGSAAYAMFRRKVM